MMNVLELLELQQTLFTIRLELQRMRKQICASPGQLSDYRQGNHRLRRELRLAKEKIANLEKEQIVIAPEEFEQIYRKFYEHNLDHIQNSPPVYQAQIKVNLLGYRFAQVSDEQRKIEQLIDLAMDYTYKLFQRMSATGEVAEIG